MAWIFFYLGYQLKAHDGACRLCSLDGYMYCDITTDIYVMYCRFINTFCQMPESKQSTKNRKFTFPFGRSPVRLQGVFEAGGAYDILTDLPWIEALLAMKPVMGPIQEKGKIHGTGGFIAYVIEI